MPETIELSMIVKNGGAALARCLRSAAPCVDRLLVGDTGSTDDSVAVAAQFGAETVAVAWEDDFAQARNRVLALARCDWVLVLDADEMLDDAAPKRIRGLIAGVGPEVGGFDVPLWNYLRDAHRGGGEQGAIANPGLVAESLPYPACTLSWRTRLFRRRAGVYFEHRVHETVAGRIDALGLSRPQSDFGIHHFGLAEDTEAERRAKRETYHRLGLSKLAAEPENPRAWFEAGLSELEHLRRPAEALGCFARASALAPRDPAAWLFAGICLIRLGRPAEALERLEVAYALGLRTAVMLEALGDAHFHAQRYDLAKDLYAEALAGGSISPLVQAKLGACEVCLAHPDSASRQPGLQRIQAALRTAPEAGELLDILTAAALMAGDLPLAARAARDRMGFGHRDSLHARLVAALAAHLPEEEPAADMLLGR